jgi:hypothetical protein
MATLAPELLTEVGSIHWPDLQTCIRHFGGYLKIDWQAWDEATARARILMLSGSKYERVRK